MKAYTDIEQSRKLAEFLPIESADMTWVEGEWGAPIVGKIIKSPDEDYTFIPCWSLATLLDVLPISINDGRHCLALISSNPSGEIEWLCCYEDDNGNLLMGFYTDNPIDSCVEMIYELKERNLL